MFARSAVRGDNANAFFKRLAPGTGRTPQWNFYKYLIDADGRVTEAFASRITPEDAGLRSKIEALLPGAGAAVPQ